MIPIGMNVPIFVKDVPRVSIFVLGWERFPITYQGSSKEYINYAIRDRDHILIGMDALIFLKDVPIFLFYEITIKG